MNAGQLNRRITIQRHVQGQDDFGQPIDTWEEVKKVWASIANETGLGTIRSQTQAGVPSAVSRYSFMVRKEAAVDVTDAMRIVHDGLIFDIRVITHDLNQRDRAYLICEQGGSDG